MLKQIEGSRAVAEAVAMSRPQVIGACAAGARAYTATASQGLLFMSEAVYNASGLGLPIVMTVANRAIHPAEREILMLPKLRIDVVAPDEAADWWLTPSPSRSAPAPIGDGKLWVSPVESVRRLRTGERDHAAVPEPGRQRAGRVEAEHGSRPAARARLGRRR